MNHCTCMLNLVYISLDSNRNGSADRTITHKSTLCEQYINICTFSRIACNTRWYTVETANACDLTHIKPLQISTIKRKRNSWIINTYFESQVWMAACCV